MSMKRDWLDVVNAVKFFVSIVVNNVALAVDIIVQTQAANGDMIMIIATTS